MNAAFEQTIIDAMAALDAGEPVATIVARYPEEGAALRPVLEAALAVQQLPPRPTQQAEAASRQRFLAEAARMKAAKDRPQTGQRRFVFAFAALAVLLLIGIGVLAFATADAVPGEALYGVKRTVENVQLLLTPAEQRPVLEQELRDRRTREVYKMLREGYEGVAEYYGEIVAIHPGAVEVGHITVSITPETVIIGSPAVGAPVHATCLVTEEGDIIGETLEVLEEPNET